MRIYSMTATFGKLENATLTLQPGLNIIEAPNEWGKSTWCAFLTAMLYGIDTRAHSTKAALADKERYAPWSGSPMAGRIDLCRNGRNITIERSTKGRSTFGVFRAYETDTGLEIPELTAANCGQVLLGVEKSVFLRAGFLKLSDLPVTQDEAFRRRLNAIVTTGDETNTADSLAQTLRDLKNRCRANRSTGLLPQAEKQRDEIRGKLAEAESLHRQIQQITQRLQQLQQWKLELENHTAALQHNENQAHANKLAAAQAALEAAAARADATAEACAALPPPDKVDADLLRLRQLRELRDSLYLEMQMLPGEPQKPEIHPAFRDKTPEAAAEQARQDLHSFNAKIPPFPWYWILLTVLGAAALLIPHWAGMLAGGAALAIGTALFGIAMARRNGRIRKRRNLLQKYAPLMPEKWVSAAEHFANSQAAHRSSLEACKAERAQLEFRAAGLQKEIAAVTGGRPLAEYEHFCMDAQRQLQEHAAAIREYNRSSELVQALQFSHKASPAPAFADTLTYSVQETVRLLSDCGHEQRQLQLKLGNAQGRLDALGQEDTLRNQLDAVTQRITKLETTCEALELAQSTLADAAAQLQRRFAPKISKRAQEIFTALTHGRYTRLTLSEDLSAQAGTGDETTLHSALWRSEGTIDQLYLSLRLAVAEVLTPDAPLILDDALVRFDDTRLAAAMAVLKEEARSKQVVLFTCQSREALIKP